MTPPSNDLEFLKTAGLWRAGEPLRLHLGCGEQRLPGYVNIDYPAAEHNLMQVRADAFADITKLQLPPGSVDEIRLHYVFEHFSRVTALALLVKWTTFLRVGGILRIESPDIIGSANTLLSDVPDKVKMGVIRHLAGDQAAPWAFHLDHWYPERFQRTLPKFGFNPVRIELTKWSQEPYLSNVYVDATKESNLSVDALLQAADELLLDSTVSNSESTTHAVWTRQLRDALNDRPVPGLRTSTTAPPTDLGPAALGAAGSQRPLNEIHGFNQLERDAWMRAKAATVPSGARVLDVGAGTCPYRPLFAHCQYTAHDFKRYEGVKLGGDTAYGEIDFVSDLTAIPVPDQSFDVVVCTEVLEHVPEPIEALRELARIVKVGGRLLITAPLGSGLHQLPFHYYGGFTGEWYRHFAQRFNLDIVELTPNGGFFRLLAQESARVIWTLPAHRELHGERLELVTKLFGDWIPRYLFALEERCFIDQFTVGYHVEAVRRA